MKTVTVAATKGGSGKSTLVTLLAVRAAEGKLRTALFDLNGDQGSLSQWWIVRGEPTNPALVEVEDLTSDVEVLRKAGMDLLLCDSPPLDLDVTEAAIMEADLVLVPVKASIFDIGAITPVVEMCKQHRKKFAFVMSGVDAKMTKLTERARQAIETDGPVLAAKVSYRADYISALTAGRSGFEIQKDLRPEIEQLWTEVTKLLGLQSKSARATKERAS